MSELEGRLMGIHAEIHNVLKLERSLLLLSLSQPMIFLGLAHSRSRSHSRPDLPPSPSELRMHTLKQYSSKRGVPTEYLDTSYHTQDP
jgi:hypothetical protein